MKIINSNGTLNKRILELKEEFNLEDIFYNEYDENKASCYITDNENDRFSIIFQGEQYYIFIIDSNKLVFEENQGMPFDKYEDIETLEQLRDFIKINQQNMQ